MESEKVNKYIESFLPIIETDLQETLKVPVNGPEELYRMMHYHMGWVDRDGNNVNVDRGKRLRPILVLLTSEAAGGDIAHARPAAASVELIHNFSLLHDDIQDRSPTRRGRETVWNIWGEANAINAGDTMFTLAHLAVPRLGQDLLPFSVQAQMLTLIDETCVELTHGQHRDMAFEQRDHVSVDEYLQMIRGKTSALIASCTELGAMSAGIDEERRTQFREFGLNLGLAFQVQDDILDVWGDPAETGKEAAIDIWQRKKSLPVLYGITHNDELAHIYKETQPFTKERVAHIIDLLNSVGAYEYARSLAAKYSKQTIAHLEAANPQGEAGVILRGIVEMLLHRRS